MKHTFTAPHHLSCSCGKLKLPVGGPSIMSAACFCSSCQKAGDLLATADRRRVKAEDGGTAYVLYRKDFVDCSHATEMLCEHRLSPTSPTRRVLAVCCGSPMFLEFQGGHWLSVYASRVRDDLRPAVELRTMVKDAPSGTRFSDGVPSYRTHSVGFMLRLFWAWAQMGFRASHVAVQGACADLGQERDSA